MSDTMLIDIYLCVTFSSIIVHWITVLLYACYHFIVRQHAIHAERNIVIARPSGRELGSEPT